MPTRQGHRRACTDVYCLPTPKDDYRILAGSGDDTPLIDLEGGDWAPRFGCGSAGFEASAIADVATPRSRGRVYALPSDAWIGSWVPRGVMLLMSRFAERSSRAPIAAASLLPVALMVPAAPTPNIGRLGRVKIRVLKALSSILQDILYGERS